MWEWDAVHQATGYLVLMALWLQSWVMVAEVEQVEHCLPMWCKHRPSAVVDEPVLMSGGLLCFTVMAHAAQAQSGPDHGDFPGDLP